MADQRGLTIVEVLVAVVIIAVGLVAIAGGMHLATVGVATGGQHTTASFLAEQRLEDIKAFALSSDTQQGWSNVNGASFGPAEAYGSIAGHPGYRRMTSISAAGGSATQKLATVSVFWTPVGSAGSQAERSVTFSVLLGARQ
jgi:prepilin-type N-terminal cleavage/methylation domain-containing protein